MSAIPNTIPFVGTIAPADAADNYPVTDPQYGLGGFRTVATTSARDSIHTFRKQEGMVVYVTANKTYYKLEDGVWVIWPYFQRLLERSTEVNTQSTTKYPIAGAWATAIDHTSTINNILIDTAGKRYIPIDLTRADTFMVSAYTPLLEQGSAAFEGFVLINNSDIVNSTTKYQGNAALNTTISTFATVTEWVNQIYTTTLFLKMVAVLPAFKIKLYNGTITIANGVATQMTTTSLPIKWSGSTAPALYSITPSQVYQESEDIFMFTTRSGGASWYGFVGGINFAGATV